VSIDQGHVKGDFVMLGTHLYEIVYVSEPYLLHNDMGDYVSCVHISLSKDMIKANINGFGGEMLINEEIKCEQADTVEKSETSEAEVVKYCQQCSTGIGSLEL